MCRVIQRPSNGHYQVKSAGGDKMKAPVLHNVQSGEDNPGAVYVPDNSAPEYIYWIKYIKDPILFSPNLTCLGCWLLDTGNKTIIYFIKKAIVYKEMKWECNILCAG